MPTYEYRCERGHTFELFHSIKDETPKTCPQCGAPAKRVPAGGAGLLFRGSGFYITDYRSKSYKERAKADRPDTGGSEPKKPSGGSEPKKPPGGGSGGPAPAGG